VLILNLLVSGSRTALSGLMASMTGVGSGMMSSSTGVNGSMGGIPPGASNASNNPVTVIDEDGVDVTPIPLVGGSKFAGIQSGTRSHILNDIPASMSSAVKVCVWFFNGFNPVLNVLYRKQSRIFSTTWNR
jgi:hypothetical protein